jgi:hypothetical protein
MKKRIKKATPADRCFFTLSVMELSKDLSCGTTGLSRAFLRVKPVCFSSSWDYNTMIIDNGATSDAASRYYGDSVKMIDHNYKDRHAVQDASGDVVLINARLEEIRALQKQDKRKDRELADAQARIADLEQKLKVKS